MNLTDNHLQKIIQTRKSHYYIVGNFAASILGILIYSYKRSKKLKALGYWKNYYLNWAGFAFYLFMGMGLVEKRLNQKVKDDISDILIDLNFSEELNKNETEAERIKARKLIYNQLRHYKNFNIQTTLMSNFSMKI